MIVYRTWSETELRKIARSSGSRQAVKDVSYGRIENFRNSHKIYVEYIPNVAFIIGIYKKNAFRIIGVATAEQHKRKGIASFFLKRLLSVLLNKDIHEIQTRTKDGVNFYLNRGFDIVGIKQGDYLMKYNF